uniref:hypothetical protein n=1 Tax=Amycolatopsis sp. CA-290885 TaxID=3239925 RepID=UPI003F49666D
MPAYDTLAASVAPITLNSIPQDKLCVTCGFRPGRPRPLPLRTVICGRCWAESGGTCSAEEIGPGPACAVPSRDPAEQLEWSALLFAEPWFQGLRRDARRRLAALVRLLRNWASWSNFTSWPTWARLQLATGWARSTMASWLRQLRLLGWLVLVEPGSTPEHRPMGSPAAATGNRAAVYALRIPATADEAHQAEILRRLTTAPEAHTISGSPQVTTPVVETWTPSLSFDLVKNGFVGSSAPTSFDLVHTPDLATWDWWRKSKALRARFDQSRGWISWMNRTPGSTAEQYAAACELRGEHPVLARMSPAAIRRKARPFWAAGWTSSDLLHALKYRPKATCALPSPAEYGVIHPVGWCASRLDAWRDQDTRRVLPAPRDLAKREQEAAHRERAAVRSRVGRVGAELLVDDGGGSLVDRVIRRGRRAAEGMTAVRETLRRRAERDEQPPQVAAAATREQAREELRRYLRRKADEHAARTRQREEGGTGYRRVRRRGWLR